MEYPRDWHTKGLCVPSGNKERDKLVHDAFFAERGDQRGPLLMKELCLKCPVRMPCLLEGLNETFGIWGGLSEIDRKAVRHALMFGKKLKQVLKIIDNRTVKRIALLKQQEISTNGKKRDPDREEEKRTAKI